MTETERLVHEYAQGPRWNARAGAMCKYWSNAARFELIERLGAYEDTGYSPEELKKLIKEKVIV